MKNRRLKVAFFASALTLLIMLVTVVIWFYQLDKTIQTKFEGKRFAPPVEIYSGPERIFKGQKLNYRALIQTLERLEFRKRETEQPLGDKDYVEWDGYYCKRILQDFFLEDTEKCLGLKFTNRFEDLSSQVHVIAFGANNIVFEVYSGNPPIPVTVIEVLPEMVAQYYGDKPIFRQIIELGDTPAICLNAVLAIEDADFLDHKGVSATGIFRAFIKNIQSGRIAQGGSTITQQLVKNYFLNPERTIKRKVTEIAMAFLIENRISKDEILETYLNLIYMGQIGPFQIRGYQSASKYYFGKPIGDLKLPECALLAAVVNSPGLYSPFRNPDKAKARRDKVLKIINDFQAKSARSYPLPESPNVILKDPAPFFMEAVRQKLGELEIDASEGLRVFTTMNIQAQEAAQKAVTEGVENLESWYKSLKKKKDEDNKVLEGALVAADPTTGYIEAMVGGRNYKRSQFNRAVQSRRQIGSIIKPAIYLAALELGTDNGRPYTPITLLDDTKFTHSYEGQRWSPSNYEKRYFDMVPMYYALSHSLNSATARLGLGLGIEEVVESLRALGLKKTPAHLPSLTLGAIELSPMNVLQIYTTLSALGVRRELTFLRRVETLTGDELYQHKIEGEQIIKRETVAQLVGMMKQVFVNGTAQAAEKLGFQRPAAGKTGTTSDTKDAWFAGFTPLHTAVAWVGYDDNTPHGLTGASGALPIWTRYMNSYMKQFPPLDFNWPEGIEEREIDVTTQKALGVPEDPDKPLQTIELIFAD